MIFIDYINKIIHGDCLKVLKHIPDNTFDSMITDPPYQLDSIRKRFGKKGSAPAKYQQDGSFGRCSSGFMGMGWDVLPSVEIWKECIRVLKPGSFSFVMCTPRQDSLLDMMTRLRDAGFVMGFTSIYWCFGNGLAKATSMSKLIDQKAGYETKMKNIEPMEKSRVIGSTVKNLRCTICKKPLISANPCRCDRTYHPITKEAKEFDGSFPGFNPKPALEVILVIMKPLSKKSYVDQVFDNGKGVTWLGKEARIPYDNSDEYEKLQDNRKANRSQRSNPDYRMKNENIPEIEQSKEGRFPANLIVSDDVFHDFRDEGTKPHPLISHVEKYKGYGSITHKHGQIVNYGDAGSFSRYFSLDAWTEKHAQFLVVTKPDMWEKTIGLDKPKYKNPRPQGTAYNEFAPEGFKDITLKQDIHATIKPLKLMSWLVHLSTRRGDLILDPFLGWGTTAIAASLFGRRFTGIEINLEYCQAAQKRVNYAIKNAFKFDDIVEEIEPKWKDEKLGDLA